TFRPAEIHKLVERGAYRPACVKNVIDEHDRFSVHVRVEFGAVDDGICTDRRKIVAVKRDVDYTVKRPDAFDPFDIFDEAFGQRNAAAADADDIQAVRALIRFDDLGREPRQRAFDTRRV